MKCIVLSFILKYLFYIIKHWMVSLTNKNVKFVQNNNTIIFYYDTKTCVRPSLNKDHTVNKGHTNNPLLVK